MTYPIYRVEREGREGSEGQVTKMRGNGIGEEPKEGGCSGAPSFLVLSLLMGPVCLLSQGRFEEPIVPCSRNISGFYANIAGNRMPLPFRFLSCHSV